MKKKMLSAFLCAAMAVTLVAGCGAPAADAGKDKGGDSKKEASEGIPKDEIKVGLYIFPIRAIWDIHTIMIWEQRKCRKNWD